MSDTTTLTAPETLPIPLDNHMVVLAKDPQQMQVSQEALTHWFTDRIELAKAELAEAETNLALAKSRKWATAGWKTQVRVAKGRVNFYDKCLAALAAGYCIIPDFPTEVFAVRTRRSRPTKNKNVRDNWSDTPAAQRPDGAPTGEGEYRSPHAFIRESRRQIEGKDYNGKPTTKTEITTWADAFDVPDFPMKAVKPVILDATGKAMALKIFDEMGVLPARRPRGRPGDPIVTGRIVRREGGREIGLTFLVQWWIDTRDL